MWTAIGRFRCETDGGLFLTHHPSLWAEQEASGAVSRVWEHGGDRGPLGHRGKTGPTRPTFPPFAQRRHSARCAPNVPLHRGAPWRHPPQPGPGPPGGALGGSGAATRGESLDWARAAACHDTRTGVVAKLVRSLGKISCAAACCGMLRHAAACFYLHMWVPTLLWEIELTCKRQHAQHCWAELITFTIRIVCSRFVDIHHSQMAQSVVAHMQTVLCLDV